MTPFNENYFIAENSKQNILEYSPLNAIKINIQVIPGRKLYIYQFQTRLKPATQIRVFE